jgi:hypothetical protein
MRTLSRLFAIATLTAFAGCGGDSTSPKNIDPVGTWQLVSVDGNPLPAQLESGDVEVTLEIVSGTLLVNDGGTFTGHELYRHTVGSSTLTQSLDYVGFYTRSNDAVAFQETDGTSYAGAISGNRMTIAYDWGTFVYQR